MHVMFIWLSIIVLSWIFLYIHIYLTVSHTEVFRITSVCSLQHNFEYYRPISNVKYDHWSTKYISNFTRGSRKYYEIYFLLVKHYYTNKTILFPRNSAAKIYCTEAGSINSFRNILKTTHPWNNGHISKPQSTPNQLALILVGPGINTNTKYYPPSLIYMGTF